MLLRSMQVTEKIFGSRSSRKKSKFAVKAVKKVAAKAVKKFTQAHNVLGLNKLNSFTNMVAKINIVVVQMRLLKLTSVFSKFENN